MIRSQIEEKQKSAQSLRGTNTVGVFGLVDDDGSSPMIRSRRVNRRRSLTYTENSVDLLGSGLPQKISHVVG